MHLRRYRARYFWGFVALVGVDVINTILPLLIKDAMDGIAASNAHRVVQAGALYLVLMLLQAVGRYLWRLFLIGTSHMVARDLRLKLYSHLQKLPLDYYQSVRTGDLMSRATNDVESVRMAVGPGILVSVDAILVFALIVPVMFWLSPKLSLLAFAFYPLVPWLTMKLGDKIDTLFEKLQTRMSNIGAYVQESFAAVRLIKSLVLGETVNERFKRLSQDYLGEGIELAKYSAVFSPTLTLLTNLGTFLILYFGARDVLSGAISLGTFIAFQRFVVQLSWPMEAIGWAVTLNREGVAANRRLDAVLNIAPVVSVLPGSSEKRPLPVKLLSIPALNFQYQRKEIDSKQRPFTLSVSDFAVTRGKKIGIVGPVGCGKSTLFNLILRLYEPPAGSIFFEGEDVRTLPLPKLRAKIAVVEQQIFLFSEPIRLNVSMGLGADLEPTEMDHLMHTANIGREVLALPEGMDSRLGERGVNLSGGQKQRIALARALGRRPDLLLLDDCFSAVDVEVEDKIIREFFANYPAMSVVFASHRLSVMPRMDEIWVMEEGRFAAHGTHAQLLHESSLYQQLWDRSKRKDKAKEIQLGLVEDNQT